MSQSTSPRLSRRNGLLISLAVLASALSAPAHASSQATVLVVGDSISAEYGLPRGTGWVALLQNQLDAGRIPARLVNASISGDTTAGGRARLPQLLKTHQPKVLLLELGANDALRGLPLAQTQANLTAMTQLAQQSGAKVLLLGMQVPPNYGASYTRQFAQVFADVGKAQKAAVLPFLLKGVADAPDALQYFQSDRIHPNAKAQARIAGNVLPELKKLLLK
ncbi:arylesterase [Brachymonas denitrificans]|uniref:arylesterase n=1 Tax=Brachymonas denitrificans TaxID=28220 RepID=UPI001BCB7F1F|nr:arylesterase [Brachymonas denitrificans]